ncbi:MAG: peptidoglycan DD-metalloendopeptidase family protein [Patescibacteria group bacterium]
MQNSIGQRGKYLAGIAFLIGIFVFASYGVFQPASQVSAETSSIREQIDEINSEVQRKKTEAEGLDDRISHYKDLIASKKLEQASLEDQVSLLENQIAKTEVGIDIAEQEVSSLELQVARLDGRIVEAEHKMGYERELLSTLARKLYRQQASRSTLDILLTHGTFADFFDELYSIVSLQRKMDETLQSIKELRVALGDERRQREDKLIGVSERKKQLEEARRELDDERSFRESLLNETKASELEYRYMLAELKREQNEADSEIAYLEKILREKIDLSDRFTEQVTVLSWPVEPTRGISATFHDAEYPYRHIFEHPGIDIRAYQGTPVRVAAAGIVARAKNAGMGYSYIMLIHNNDISTVYGHISRITVKEDTFVERGEVIGYSGGMPGTPGAGQLTTGPHLHFETRLRGIPVDPMQYMVKF